MAGKVKRELKRPGVGCMTWLTIGSGLMTVFFFAVAFGTLFEKDYPFGATLLIFFMSGIFGAVTYWGGLVFYRRMIAGRYVELIANQNHAHVEDIAQLMGKKDLSKVMKNIQMCIEKGYLPGYSLDPKERLVNRIDPTAPPQKRETYSLSFVCTSCGAKNHVETTPGGPVKCHYCGTPHVE